MSFEFTEGLSREIQNSSGPAGIQMVPLFTFWEDFLILVEVHIHSLLF